jgi:hypothetical protein
MMVYPHAAHADAPRVVDEVVAHDVAPRRPVPARVDGADIARVEADPVDLVALDEDVVALVEDGTVGVVVDQVPRGAQANPREEKGRLIAPGPLREVVYVVPLREVPRAPECLSVPARDDGAAIGQFLE